MEALAIQIVRVLRGHHYQSFFVGGCVRDRILGIRPQDYDVATDATPEEVAKLFPKARMVGAHFGVVLIADGEGEQVEVATFRSDQDYSDGRRPDQVRFEKDPKLDVLRRDFTINGLLEDPLSGQVIDFVYGRTDLANGIIRTIDDPCQRFAEDHLRMLRAVRFAARFRFEIEPQTLQAIRDLAPQIQKISAERIRDELTRILTEGEAKRGFELLDATRLLSEVLPEVKAFQGVQQPPEFHPEGDVWTHVLLMLQNLPKGVSPTLAWGALLHDVGKPVTFRIADRIRFDGHAEVGASIAERILQQLRFSNEEIEQVVTLVANHMKFKDVFEMRESTLKRFLRLPYFEEHLELHRLDCLASNGYLAGYEFAKNKLTKYSVDDVQPVRLIGGRDLIDAGYTPGPRFATALEAVETAQLEGEISTRDEALALAERVLNADSRAQG